MYTHDMAEAVRKLRQPFPFVMDVRENEWGLTLIVYPDVMGSLSAVEQMQVLEHLKDVAHLLQSYGLRVRIKGVSGVPQRI